MCIADSSTCRRTWPAFAAILLSSALSFGQATFTNQQYPVRSSALGFISADINGDGIPDLISATDRQATVTTYIGNGDGSFQAGVDHPVATPRYAPSATAGDIDRDGKTDIVFATGTNVVTILWGNGDGTFTRQDYNEGKPLVRAQIADFNRDGKPDIAFTTEQFDTEPTTYGVDLVLGTGTRTLGAESTLFSFGVDTSGGVDIRIGDFDGDAKEDMVVIQFDCSRGGCGTGASTLYGNGDGSFTEVAGPSVSSADSFTVADLNQDGRSDLVLGINDFEISNGAGLRALYGNSNRTFTSQDIATNPYLQSNPAVADFNGDGLNDIAVVQQLTCDTCSTPTQFMEIVYRQSDGSYSAPQEIAIADGVFARTGLLAGVFSPKTAATASGDHRPDLITTSDSGTLYELVNTTASGYYGNCGPLTKSEQIQLCQPGSVAGSSAPFSVRADSFYPIRKLEIWVDGSKRSETYHNAGLEAWVDANLPLGDGTHNATVVMANYDNRLVKKNFSFSVGTSSCQQPSTATATVICSPANGSTVSSPVSVQARGGSSVTFMEVWVDGTKRFQNSGNTVSTTLTLGTGSHHMSVYSKSGSTVLSKAVSDFTVK